MAAKATSKTTTKSSAQKNLDKFKELEARALKTKQDTFGKTAEAYVIRPEDGYDIDKPIEIHFPDYERFAAIERAHRDGNQTALVPLVLGDEAHRLNEALKRQSPSLAVFLLIEIANDAMRALFGESFMESGKA